MSNQTSIEPELHSLLNKLTVEIANDRKEVELREKRIKKNEVLLQAVKSSLDMAGHSNGTTGYGAKAETVRNAIQQITKARFTQSDIEMEVKRLNPTAQIDRSRIRSALWTLAHKQDYIRQVRQGTNRQPAEFEKLAAAATAVPPMQEAQRLGYGISTSSGVITVGGIEAYVRESNRRMKELTAHFKVDEETIRKFLEPNSKVYEATRGWIKIRE